MHFRKAQMHLSFWWGYIPNKLVSLLLTHCKIGKLGSSIIISQALSTLFSLVLLPLCLNCHHIFLDHWYLYFPLLLSITSNVGLKMDSYNLLFETLQCLLPFFWRINQDASQFCGRILGNLCHLEPANLPFCSWVPGTLQTAQLIPTAHRTHCSFSVTGLCLAFCNYPVKLTS